MLNSFGFNYLSLFSYDIFWPCSHLFSKSSALPFPPNIMSFLILKERTKQKMKIKKDKQKTPIKPKTNMPQTRVCCFTSSQPGTCPGVWLTCPVALHCGNKHSLSWQVLIAKGFLVGVGLCPLPFLSIGISLFEPVLGLSMVSQPGFLFPLSCSPGSTGSPSQAYSKELSCCFSLFSYMCATSHHNTSLSKPETPPRNGHPL